MSPSTAFLNVPALPSPRRNSMPPGHGIGSILGGAGKPCVSNPWAAGWHLPYAHERRRHTSCRVRHRAPRQDLARSGSRRPPARMLEPRPRASVRHSSDQAGAELPPSGRELPVAGPRGAFAA